MIEKCGCVFVNDKLIRSCSVKHQETYDQFIEEVSNKGSSLSLGNLGKMYEKVLDSVNNTLYFINPKEFKIKKKWKERRKEVKTNGKQNK